MNKRLANPFVVGRYITDYYFCDRKEETKFLIKQINNGRDVTLISPRRMGKSDLIHHFFNTPEVKENFKTIFIDIYATTSLTEFTALLSRQIFNLIKKDKSFFKKAFDTFRSLRPLAKIDAISGEPAMELTISSIQQPDLTLNECFEYLEKSETPFIIAIDEFQQIAHYNSSGIEAKLRTLIQQCKKTRFVFAGSEQSLMTEIFNSPNKPFYQSCISMSLSPIPKDKYISFACSLYTDYNKLFNENLFEKIYDRFEGVTWFVQMMMNEVFALTPIGERPEEDSIETAEGNIIGTQSFNYAEIMARLSVRQRELLNAIARHPELSNEITSSEFLTASGFKTASMVQAALRGLLKTGIVTNKRGGYVIYDNFFKRWIERNQL